MTPTLPGLTPTGFHGGPQQQQNQPDPMRLDWRNALGAWHDQRPTHQSMFPDFSGVPTMDMRNQFAQARTDWQNAMPQMPGALAALMPQGGMPAMQGMPPGMQGQQGWRVSPMDAPPMSTPLA
jgi:hypothetical protein